MRIQTHHQFQRRNGTAPVCPRDFETYSLCTKGVQIGDHQAPTTRFINLHARICSTSQPSSVNDLQTDSHPTNSTFALLDNNSQVGFEWSFLVHCPHSLRWVRLVVLTAGGCLRCARSGRNGKIQRYAPLIQPEILLLPRFSLHSYLLSGTPSPSPTTAL